MKIALIGYGKMGHAIEALAGGRGHEIVATVDNDADWARLSNKADVAIEFSTPTTAEANIRRCWQLGLPVVAGTTGWYDRLDTLVADCRRQRNALFVASNFSIGMNIMFALNERLAQLMASHPEYHVDISETHHIHKLDAPSGTALTLRDQIAPYRPATDIPIASFREGEVPGIHTVTYDSEVDTLSLTHSAKSRQGLALGALLAAEFLVGRQGYYTMKDLLAL